MSHVRWGIIGPGSIANNFADALKEECDELLGKYTDISAFTENNSEKKLVRPLLVTWGTSIRRKLDENCWIKKKRILLCFTCLTHQHLVYWVKFFSMVLCNSIFF